MNTLSNPAWPDDADRPPGSAGVPPPLAQPPQAAPEAAASANEPRVSLRTANGSGEVIAGLKMIFSSAASGSPADEIQVSDFIRFAGHRGIQLAELRLLVERQALAADSAAHTERLLWSVLPIYNPGRTVLLLGASGAPAGSAGATASVRTAVESLCRIAADRGVQLAQVLLDPADRHTIDLYEPTGFRRMAELIYLHRALRRSPPPPLPAPQGITLQTYSPATHDRFAAGIMASYIDSHDCPALNGIRNIDDVIAGHQASGEFDPNDWFLVSRNNEPAGVLLLNRSGQIGGMELVYLGIAPVLRGKGFGQWLMSIALARVWQHKLSSLTLAVDAGNEPALHLYSRFGMQRVMSKLAMMRDLRKPSAE